MNNEEKKAIESIKELIYGNYDSIILKDEEGYTLWNEDFETILNIIEKQQKEIDDKKEEIYAIAKTNYILGQTDERSQWYKKINEKIEYIEKEMEKDEVDEFGIHSQGWLALDWFVDNLKELIGKEE